MFALGTRNRPSLRTSKRMKIFLIALFLAVIVVVSTQVSEFSLYSTLALSCIIVAATFISVNRGLNKEKA